MPKFLKELPPSGKGRHEREPDKEHLRVATRLRKRPGVWMYVFTMHSKPAAVGFATAIRRGRYVAFRPVGHFEAQTRDADLYARYVGDQVYE